MMPGQPRLRERVRQVIGTRRYSRRMEQACWYWIRYYIRFHDMRHPAEMGERDVRTFLTWLATERNVAGATQNQALNALVFLYGKVLDQPLGEIGRVVRAKWPLRRQLDHRRNLFEQDRMAGGGIERGGNAVRSPLGAVLATG